ncbi:MAG: GNAT family N-acetyltransferase [Chloroflexota bacterium]|nr:GNAT family N-acetyltransferase [Chloroflexota bacterium]
MVFVTEPVETDRLLLRPYEEGDLDAIADLLSIPEVMRYLFEEPLSREEAAATLHRRIPMRKIEQEGDRLALVVTLRESGTVIGTVNLTLRSEEHRQGEIGYVFHPDHQGRGYATEAMQALLDCGFQTGGFHRIYGRCDARNFPSARLMERLGMRREAHFVENEWFKGVWGSEFMYAILKREWEVG